MIQNSTVLENRSVSELSSDIFLTVVLYILSSFEVLTRHSTVKYEIVQYVSGAPGGAVGRGTALQTGRSRVRFIGIYHGNNPSGRIMTLGSTQPLTEMGKR
jgi:hypothetical protein